MMKKTGKWAFLLLTILVAILVISVDVLTVEAATKVKLSKKKVSIVIGGTSKIKVKNVPKGAKIKYKSSKKAVATVTKKGKIKGIKNGTAKITVTVKKKNTISKKLKCKVTVKKPEFQLKTRFLDTGQTAKLSIKNKPKKAKFTWTSSDPVVAIVDSKGMVTAKSKGFAVINVNIKTAKKVYKLSCIVIINTEDFDTSEATEYYKNNAELIEILDAEKSNELFSENNIKTFLTNKGFGDQDITYDYSIQGELLSNTTVDDDSNDPHPMYQTLYLSQNGDAWAIYVINGSIFANPISFNLDSDLESQLLFSESETLTSYDDVTNRFYITKPYSSEAIVQTVKEINAETLNSLTIEEICKLTGADFSMFENEDEEQNETLDYSSSYSLNGNEDDSTADKYSYEDPLIVVSLGDSYSSGEGIEPFYYQEEPLQKKVKIDDWLAHRSEKSWPSFLEFNGIDGALGNYKMAQNLNEEKVCKWYFVAASGAETKHFREEQNKNYDIESNSSLVKKFKLLSPQLNVFNGLTSKADYVTLTIGGNDVKFGDIVTACVCNSTYLNLNTVKNLKEQLTDTWLKIGDVKNNIRNAYKDVESAAGKQAAIIVAGYPRLLSPDGKGEVISKEEAKMVNENVSLFNDVIEGIVEDCSDNGMNIHFVDVESEFTDEHLAYSDSEWINKVKFPPQPEDLEIKIGSAYSMHPNKEGAKAYARCVNKKIKQIEGTADEDALSGFENFDIVFNWKEIDSFADLEIGFGSPFDGELSYLLNGGFYDSNHVIPNFDGSDPSSPDSDGTWIIHFSNLDKNSTYCFYIHDTFEGDLKSTYETAEVKIYLNGSLEKTIKLSDSESDGSYWNVFGIKNDHFVANNTLSDEVFTNY